MTYIKKILTFDVSAPPNTPLQYGTSIIDDCITSGIKRIRIVGNSGAVFSLKRTRVLNVNTNKPTVECTQDLLTNVAIPPSGVYIFNYSISHSTTTNRHDIQITPGHGTVLGERIPSSTPTYSINQYPTPIITLTSASSSLDSVTESGSDKTYIGKIRNTPDSASGHNKVTYTRTISHGSKPLYISKIPSIETDYTSSLDIKKVVEKVNNTSDVKINPYVKSGDTAITYGGDVKVGMQFTGEITHTKNFISFVINDICKDCIDSSNILRLTDTRNIEVGMLVGAIGLAATVISIENDTDIVISKIASPTTLNRETTLTFTKTIGGHVNRVIDINHVVIDSPKIIPAHTVLTFSNNESEISGDISVSGMGSTEVTITGEIIIDKVGKESVTYTQQVDNFITFTPSANNGRVTTAKDTAVNIDLVVNDRDVNYADKTASIVSYPKSGVMSGDSDNPRLYTYTPNAGFLGKDSFTFKINDGTTDSATRKINITVN